jgi:hypothetical protein
MNAAIVHLWTPLAATPLVWLTVTVAAYLTGRLVQRVCGGRLPRRMEPYHRIQAQALRR